MKLLQIATLFLLVSFISSGPITGYDLHVYFFENNNASKTSAENLFKQAQYLFPNLNTKIFYAPVGPHVMPMFEIDIPASSFSLEKVIPWIMQNHGSHSALLHPHSGDEMKDHTEYPFWLGQPVH